MLRETVGHLRDLPRYSQILGAMMHYGYQDVLSALNLEGLAKPIEWVSRGGEPPPAERPKRVRLMFEELGPTFVKLGQLLSTRSDLLPAAYTEELAKLREEVAPFPFEEARRILEREYGRPLEEVFAWFDPKPTAAASISQVHRARLPDGREAAVKIRRPGIEKIVQADLDILRHLAELAEKGPEWLRAHRPKSVAREFETSLRRELDLGVELRTMEHFRARFGDDPDARIPEPFPEWSTSRVLAMEFVEGLPINDPARLRAAGIDPKETARRGARAMMRQIFEFGLFHADPHPGNLRVQSDGRIAILDYGMFGRLDRGTREVIAELLGGLMNQDTDAALRALDDLRITAELRDRSQLRRDVGDLIASYSDLSLRTIDLRVLLEELFAVVRAHRLRLPPDMVLLIRGLVTIESTGRTLDPDFDIGRELRPALRRVTLRRMSPQRLARESARAVSDFRRIAALLPDVLTNSLESIRRGELTLKFDLQHFEHLVRQLVRAANTLAIGIVLAGLLVAGSSLIQTEGLRTMGNLAMGVALVMAVWLVWYMSRRA